MVVVKAQPGESADRLIQRFRQKVLHSKLLLEIKDRERYETPSEKRKKKKYQIRYMRELQKIRDK